MLLFLAFSTVTFAQTIEETFNKGLEQFKAKQYEEAIQSFSFVTTKNPNEYVAFYNIGLCYYNLKRYSQAVSAFQQSVKISPDYSKPYLYLGIALDINNRYTEAVSAFENGIRLEPNNARLYYELGLAHRVQKNYNEAVTALKKAVQLNPQMANGFTELGNSLVNLKMFAEAITNFNQAIALDSTSPNAYLGLGNAYYNNNNYLSSIPNYKKASELLPTWETAHLYLADAYLNSTQYALAVISYKTVIGLNDKLADAYYGLGLTYYNQKNLVLAKQQLEKLKLIDVDKANLLSQKLSGVVTAVKPTPTPTPKPIVKSAQRIADEKAVAERQDLGFDAAFVTGTTVIRETGSKTGKLLLAVKRGDILSLTSRNDENNWYQVIEEKSGIEGWIDGNLVVIKLTGNTANVGPELEESANTENYNANPIVSITNLEEKTTLSIKINGTLHKILPKATKVLTIPPGKMVYYGWSPGIRPARGNSVVQKGKKYNWVFKINRR